MKLNKLVNFNNGSKASFEFITPEICPQCKYALVPEQLALCAYRGSLQEPHLVALYLCNKCYQPFICSFKPSSISPNSTYVPAYCAPYSYSKKEFDAHIQTISPSFVKIFNQANEAESSSLDEVAGIGYRKALEFLIKDYLIHKNPDEKDTIERMELGNCIANKVENTNLKTVASRSAWLGNDMAHYVQKFEDKDINDMKSFIDACVYWICMELITEEALGIEKQGR